MGVWLVSLLLMVAIIVLVGVKFNPWLQNALRHLPKGHPSRVQGPVPAAARPAPAQPARPISYEGPKRSLKQWFSAVLQNLAVERIPLVAEDIPDELEGVAPDKISALLARVAPVLLRGTFHNHQVEIILVTPYQFRARVFHLQPAPWNAWLVSEDDRPLVMPLRARPEPATRAPYPGEIPSAPEGFNWRVRSDAAPPLVLPVLSSEALLALDTTLRTIWRSAVTPEVVELDILLRDIALGGDPAWALAREADDFLDDLIAVSLALTAG